MYFLFSISARRNLGAPRATSCLLPPPSASSFPRCRLVRLPSNQDDEGVLSQFWSLAYDMYQHLRPCINIPCIPVLGSHASPPVTCSGLLMFQYDLILSDLELRRPKTHSRRLPRFEAREELLRGGEVQDLWSLLHREKSASFDSFFLAVPTSSFALKERVILLSHQSFFRPTTKSRKSAFKIYSSSKD
ncbi:hypothetical protein L596_028068 [Steinernema carpocapsae]|uniref:Uncharacterized protein n=1 Tax=Steinernema carpocapsae TaxID=34508 RepID=A0A4U5LXC9_STECR|nr:hypothetical protein L596_028068 [Steinernema carpocapsae]